MIYIRVLLKKKIQELEKHLSVIQKEEQCKAFTATPMSFQFQTPITTLPKSHAVGFEAQVHTTNELGAHDNWNSSSFSPVHSYCSSSIPYEREHREPYTPKVIEINYIDGSIAESWSGVNFPWTKKLEVCVTTFNLLLPS